MMQNIIHYAPLALKDMDEIFDYISKDLQNPIAAENTIQGILSSISDLKTLSNIGAKVALPNGLDSGYYSLAYKNYRIFYRQENANVFIDRIMYGKRDYMNILFS